MDSPAKFLHYLAMFSDELLFLHSDHFSRCRARVDKRFTGYFSLQFMTRGAIELSYDDKRFTLEGAWFWTAFPGPRIRFGPVGGSHWNHRYAAFRGAEVSRWQAAGLFFNGPERCPPGRVKNLAARFDELLRLLREGGLWSVERAGHLIEGILLELAVEARRAQQREPWLENLLAELTPSNLLAPNYHALARVAGMSLRTLRRRFRELTGVPLHAYVMEKRIAAARRLLGSTNEPIKDIATRLGYRDVYFFSRQFKQLQGLPPASYRKSRLMDCES